MTSRARAERTRAHWPWVATGPRSRVRINPKAAYLWDWSKIIAGKSQFDARPAAGDPNLLVLHGEGWRMVYRRGAEVTKVYLYAKGKEASDEATSWSGAVAVMLYTTAERPLGPGESILMSARRLEPAELASFGRLDVGEGPMPEPLVAWVGPNLTD